MEAKIMEVMAKNKKIVGMIAIGAIKAGIGYTLIKNGKKDFQNGAKGIGKIVEVAVEAIKDQAKA